MSRLWVRQPGLLSLLQDTGRVGHARLGLGTGGPLDPQAFAMCQRLLDNPAACTAIEVSFGGLELEAEDDCQICVCGATLPVAVNGRAAPMWQVIALRDGDQLQLGYSETGCRSYLGVRGGFAVSPQFGSTATVMREGIGGLNGGRLNEGDVLPIRATARTDGRRLPEAFRPVYHHHATLRVIPGYQQRHFDRLTQRRFFASEYTVSERCDRMGYRLTGPETRADISSMLSEGIALGAVQFPADGQPIVLLNDRQTIGGYPKLGTVCSLDCAALAQLRPGDTVNFTPISEHAAHNALHLAQFLERSRHLEPAPL